MATVSRRDTIKGMGLTAGAGIIFGAFPIFTELYIRFGGDVDSFNLYGFILTVIILAAYMLIKRISFAVPKKSIFFVLLAGVFNVVTRVLLTYSYSYLDVGVATTLHFMYPLFAAVLGAIFFREKMPWYKWIAFVVASASVALFSTGTSGNTQLIGIVLALASAVCFALYMLTTEKANLAQLHPVVFVFYVCVVSTVGSALVGLGGGQMTLTVPWKAVIVLVACAIFNNAIAFALQQQGVRFLGAAMAALFSLFEPVFSCIFGGIFLQQIIGWKAICGIVLILLALALIVILDDRKRQKT